MAMNRLAIDGIVPSAKPGMNTRTFQYVRENYLYATLGVASGDLVGVRYTAMGAIEAAQCVETDGTWQFHAVSKPCSAFDRKLGKSVPNVTLEHIGTWTGPADIHITSILRGAAGAVLQVVDVGPLTANPLSPFVLPVEEFAI